MKRYAGQDGYEGQQYVGIDLHRHRSVVVRMTDAGELLEAVQVVNSPLALAEVMRRAGEHPEVVLEATYGCDTRTGSPQAPWLSTSFCIVEVIQSNGSVELVPAPWARRGA